MQRVKQVNNHLKSSKWKAQPLPTPGNDHLIGGNPKESQKTRVVCVGAGASGIAFVREWRQFGLDKDFDVVVYEALENHGGTWWVSRYNGCACDVPSILYSFSWLPKVDWTAVYAGSFEIWQYFDQCARKVDLPSICRYQTRITEARWDDSLKIWRLTWQREQWIEDGSEFGKKIVLSSGQDWCHFLINGSGALSKPKNPDIPGFNTFKGKVMHTAHWDEDFDFTSRKVGVIGTGASGIQCISNLIPMVSKMTVFQRTPSWITAYRLGNSYPPGLAEELKDNLQAYHAYRAKLWDEWELGWDMFIPGTLNQQKMQASAIKRMQRNIKDPELLKKLTPSYPIGCRRITPSPIFLERIQEPHVEVVTDKIKEICPSGVMLESGIVKPCEVLVCATGFDTNFIPGYTIIGKSGNTLAQDWSKYSKAYNSITVPNYPNFFLCLGPNAPLGSNSTLPVLERICKYVWCIMIAMKANDISTIEVDKNVTDDIWQKGQDWLKKNTVWASRGCGSWYKRGGELDQGGVIQGIWPGTTNSFLKIISNVNWSHYHLYPQPEKPLPFSGNLKWDPDAGLSEVSKSYDWTNWDYPLKI